ncbi:MAG: 5'-nucleotidase C-terminal domain-containing protein [Nitriliruptor sp.]
MVADGSITPSTVVTVDGREVGIIGATTEVLRSVSAPGPDVIINQVLPAVTAQVAALEAAGVEIIILASHLQNLDNERELIGELSGVDAVIGGGGAEDLRDAYPFVIEDADGVEVPLVTTPGDYRDVGRLVLEFDAAGDLVAVGDDSALLAVPPYGPKDERIATTVEAPVAAALDELARTPVADNEVPLDARTATVRTRESNIANLLTDGMLRASRDRAVEYGVPVADVALQNGGGTRGNAIMTEDELSALFTFNTAPFGNRIAVDTITAAKLLELIEHGLSGLPAVEGRFGHWAGVEFSYDVSEPAGSRVVDAEVTRADGTTFVLVADGVLNADASDDITLVGLNFTLNCGDAYPFDGCDQEPRAAEFTELGLTDQQAFRNHLEAIEAVTSSNYPDLTVDFDRYNRYGPVGGNFLD